MSKLAFASKRILDEWNPHIVRYVRNEIPKINTHDRQLIESLSEMLVGAIEKDASTIRAMIDKKSQDTVIDTNLKKWVETWNSAQNILNEEKQIGIYPLAYRLDPTLSTPLSVDPINGSKFGGVPDFRHNYIFQHLKNKGNDTSEIISKLWPTCGGCGEHMKFLAGVDLSDWLIPIHHMTANNPTHTDYGTKISESELKYHQYSGLGFAKTLCTDNWPAYKPFFQIFYCDEPHFDSPAFDSRLQIEHRYNDRDEKLLDLETYREVVSEFISNKKIQSTIPIQTLEGLTLKFDLDMPEGRKNAKMKNIEYKAHDVIYKHPELFGTNAPYQFFGKPRSQQTEQRYACQNSYPGLHRMAPIVNWTDQDKDFTYQVYGCLRCQGQESHEIYCKTDGSCT